MLSIPEHKTCRDCGSCCGPVLVTIPEINMIKSYIADHDVEIFDGEIIDCPFLNKGKKRCEIYPVRPVICRLMGVSKGMDCRYGNSASINGTKYIDPIAVVYLMRDIKWRK